MQVSQVLFNEFLISPKTQFVIPIYQRNYDWQISHCEQLLNDIIAAGRNNQQHFIGSIVFIYDQAHQTGGAKELVIIDGQQRLTTITLLYVALYHYAIDNNLEDLASEIHDTVIINKYVDNEHKLKLKPTENNDKDLKALIYNTQIETKEHYASNIITNYNYFRSRISADTIEYIQKGLLKLIYVEISLERDRDNAQRIFESLNSTGLDLSSADLIRNYILMERTATEQQELYNQYWEYIEVNTRIDGKNKLPEFIRDYLTYTQKDIFNKDKIYQTFKQKFPIPNIAELKDLLAKIKQLAQPYGKLLDPNKEPDADIRKELANINQLEITTSYPFLMKVYDDYIHETIDKDCFIRILQFIQTFVIRRFILDLPPNRLNKIFMSLYYEIDPTDYETSLYKSLLRLKGGSRMPNNMEVRAALKNKDIYNSKPKNRDYLFEHLENWGKKELYVDINGNDNITIEHIFPQNPAEEWKEDLKEEYEDFLNKYLHTIGNLTLSGNNKSIRNYRFLTKRDMNHNGGEQGYAYSQLWLNQALGKFDAWNVETYKTRTKILTDRFLEIWSLPEITDLNDIDNTLSDNEEINIFDVEEPKKMEYAKFLNRPVNSKDSSIGYPALYIYIIKKMFELAQDDFIKDLGDTLSISTSIVNMKKPMSISETYFVDVNLSNIEILRRIKLILSTFHFEDELLIKLKTKGE